LRDLSRGKRAVHPRQHEAVGRSEGDVLEAKEGIGGEGEHAVDVAERIADDVGVLDPVDRLQDDVARRELEGDLVGADRHLRLRHELPGSVGPAEDAGEDLVDVSGDGALEAVRVEGPSSRRAWPRRFFSRTTRSVARSRFSFERSPCRTSISPRRSSVTLVVAFTRCPRWKRTL